MQVMRAFKYKIYPDSTRKEKIDARLSLLCTLYNKTLEKLHFEYRKNNDLSLDIPTIRRYVDESAAASPELSSIPSSDRAEIARKLFRSYKTFLARKAAKASGRKIKARFLPFKSPLDYKSMFFYKNSSDFYITLDKDYATLTIPEIGRVRIKLYRDIEGLVRMLVIKRYAGSYYAIFVSSLELDPDPVEVFKNPVGVDLGLNNFVMLSNGVSLDKPKFVKQRASKVAKLRKRVNKRKKGSKRRAEAVMRLQRELAYTANQSLDFSYKAARQLLDQGFTVIFLEKLNIEGMVHNHSLAGSILNASWGKFTQILRYKAESEGVKVIKVPSKDTTRKCSRCGYINKVKLGQSIYRCDSCGLIINRDLNAATNILKIGLALLKKEMGTAGPVGG